MVQQVNGLGMQTHWVPYTCCISMILTSTVITANTYTPDSSSILQRILYIKVVLFLPSIVPHAQQILAFKQYYD